MTAQRKLSDATLFALTQYHQALAYWRSDGVQNSDMRTRLSAWHEAMTWQREAQRRNKEAC